MQVGDRRPHLPLVSMFRGLRILDSTICCDCLLYLNIISFREREEIILGDIIKEAAPTASYWCINFAWHAVSLVTQ